MAEKSPIDFFGLFFSEQVLDLIETETRRYTEQYLRRESDYLQQHPKARAHEWKRFPLMRKELEVFLALIIAMGVCGFPTLRCVYMYMLACAYWNMCKCVHIHTGTYIQASMSTHSMSTVKHTYTNTLYIFAHTHTFTSLLQMCVNRCMSDMHAYVPVLCREACGNVGKVTTACIVYTHMYTNLPL